ncbi:MAG: DUF2065 domain-containing protein [Fulvimarina manganoxydans]|uniref:DUF2065 domain-containing protein n=1 Tax=Fulvimarina manganoxydans TaxID=937218 RepID=UPI0023548EF2|nr:DUF2065 domain-containing protein [Fulvimarina manganoxydans]MCK5934447.1 DUF2065 domain-containing protein [Fulvimarina manganoxydans]
MTEFLTALGLVLVIEGVLYAGFPGLAKRMARQAVETPDGSLRQAGLFAAVVGLVLIWLIRS